jgi:hypothetical protein
MAVGDSVHGRFSLIVCKAVEDRLYGRWRSFVWPLEIVCMAVVQTISNGHATDQSPTTIQTISNGYANDQTPTDIQTISNGHPNGLQVCMVVGGRLYGRRRSYSWLLEIVCYGRWRSFVWQLEII